VYVIENYEYCPHPNKVIGGGIAYSPLEFLGSSTDNINSNSGREMVQFFIQSVQGGYQSKIGHWIRPQGSTNQWIIDKLKELVKTYQIPNVIEIVCSSSDGDLGSADIEEDMKSWMKAKFNLFWVHFGDFSHTVRKGRNAFRNRSLRPRTQNFSVHSLLKLIPKYDELADCLKQNALSPRYNEHGGLLIVVQSRSDRFFTQSCKQYIEQRRQGLMQRNSGVF
jgi:hypothetical protein